MNGDEMEDFLGGMMIYETLEDGRSCYQSEILWILANKIEKLERENEMLWWKIESNKFATVLMTESLQNHLGSRDAQRILNVLMARVKQ